MKTGYLRNSRKKPIQERKTKPVENNKCNSIKRNIKQDAKYIEPKEVIDQMQCKLEDNIKVRICNSYEAKCFLKEFEKAVRPIKLLIEENPWVNFIQMKELMITLGFVITHSIYEKTYDDREAGPVTLGLLFVTDKGSLEPPASVRWDQAWGQSRCSNKPAYKHLIISQADEGL